MPHISRFPIHDELTAPEGSLPVLKAATAGTGAAQLPNLLGVLAGSPAVLRGYTRFRNDLRTHGTLEAATTERIALAVAGHYRSEPGTRLHTRAARRAGLGIDEVAAARAWRSADRRQQALLRWIKPLVTDRGRVPAHLHEAALEAGWTEAQLLEAMALVALESLTAMINVAGEVPVDGSVEAARMRDAA